MTESDVADVLVRALDSHKQFEVTDDPADLDTAIGLARECVRASTPADPVFGDSLSVLASALQTRFERFGHLVDLEESIAVGRSAVQAAGSMEDVAEELHNLGLGLQMRFEHRNDRRDIDEAVEAARTATEVTAPDDDAYPLYVAMLSVALQTRFDRLGDPTDLDAAITAAANAAQRSPEDSPDRTVILSTFGSMLAIRFRHRGDINDLDASVQVGRTVVGLVATPPGRSAFAAGVWSNLGLRLVLRYEYTGELADLSEAVEAARTAVSAVAENDPARTTFFRNLALVLQIRFEQTGDARDIDDAVGTARAVVADLPPDHPEHGTALASLGLTLLLRYTGTRAATDLAESVHCLRAAAAIPIVPPTHRSHVMALLSTALLRQYEHSGQVAVLDETVAVARSALQTAPADHPIVGILRYHLGLALADTYRTTADNELLDTAIDEFRQASHTVNTPTRHRLNAARAWGEWSARLRRWPAAAAGYTAAVTLLPVAAWHGAGRASREWLLTDWHGVAVDLSACAAAARRDDCAVALLDSGRNVLWAQLLDIRADLATVRARAPHLADRLRVVAQELNRADTWGATQSP
ncbi:hypothetical protein ACWD5Z_28250 [Micromonospora chokoriensis]